MALVVAVARSDLEVVLRVEVQALPEEALQQQPIPAHSDLVVLPQALRSEVQALPMVEEEKTQAPPVTAEPLEDGL